MSREFKRTPYSEKLRDPRWQKRRLEILQRDDWECAICFDRESTLNVHHRWYQTGQEPWEATDSQLITLCETCHEREGQERRDAEAKLLHELRTKFFSAELDVIRSAFHYMPTTHSPVMIAAALDHFLIDPENIELMVDQYLKHVAEQDGGEATA